MAQWPDLPTIRAWINMPEAEISDDQLELIVETEISVQLAYCNIEDEDDPPEPLVQALLRRCARVVAARALPLGTLPTGSTGVPNAFGMTGVLSRYDAEIERMESPYRVEGIA